MGRIWSKVVIHHFSPLYTILQLFHAPVKGDLALKRRELKLKRKAMG
jgi:hypothetical protein